MFAKLALVSTLAGLAAAAPISTEAHHNEVFGDFSEYFVDACLSVLIDVY